MSPAQPTQLRRLKAEAKARLSRPAVWDRGGTEQQDDEHQNADHQLERPLVAAIGQDNDRTEYRTPM
jgi:hypothetical protein